MTENQSFESGEYYDSSPTENKKPKKTWLFVGIGAVLVMCLCVVVAFIIIDPFDLKARFFGSADPVAQMIPDDSFMYVGVNMLEFNSANLRGIAEAFIDAYDIEADLDDFLMEMEDALGFSSIEDLSPWIGQFAGFVVEDISPDMLMYGDEPTLLFMVEVRNKNKANEFVDDLIAHLEDNGDEFRSIDISGSSFYENQDDWSPFVIGLYENMLVIGTDERAVDDLIRFNTGSRKNNTLAKSDSYKEIIKQMPKNRLATLYMNSERYFDILETMLYEEFYGMDPSFMRTLQDMMADVGMSISVVDAGIQFDLITASVDPENQPFADLNSDLSGYRQKLDSYFPSDTFVYFTGYIPEGYYDNMSEFIQDQIGTDEDMMYDYREAIRLFEDEVGIDMERFARSLEGEFAIGLFDQSGGLLNEMLWIPFGMNIMFGTNDPAEVSRAFDRIHDLVSEDPFVEFDNREVEGFELEGWIVPELDSRAPALVYGFSDENILISSGDEIYDLLEGSRDSLADNPDYQNVKDTFSKDDLLVLYFDMDGFLRLMRDVDPYTYDDMILENGESVFGPMTQIALSSLADRSSHQHSKLIIFVDYQPAR